VKVEMGRTTYKSSKGVVTKSVPSRKGGDGFCIFMAPFGHGMGLPPRYVRQVPVHSSKARERQAEVADLLKETRRGWRLRSRDTKKGQYYSKKLLTGFSAEGRGERGEYVMIERRRIPKITFKEEPSFLPNARQKDTIRRKGTGDGRWRSA